MFLKTIWYILNIFFCVYNLNNLNTNKLSTVIDYEKDRLTEDYVSICLSIKSAKLNCGSEDVICNRLKDLFIHIENRSIIKSPNDIIFKADNLKIASYYEFVSETIIKVWAKFKLTLKV